MAMRFRLCALAGGLLALGACHALIARTFAGQMLDRTHLVKTFDESFATPPSFWSPDKPGGRWKANFYFNRQEADAGDGWQSRTIASNGEQEYYAPPGSAADPFQWHPGELDIVARRNPGDPRSHGLPYVSGLITTERSFNQRYGYFEAKIAMPLAKGLWPAFWLLPQPTYVNGWGTPVGQQEIDIFESIGEPQTLYMTDFSDESGTKVADEQGRTVYTQADLTRFHTYGMLVTATDLVWYFDDHEVRRRPNHDFHMPAYMLLNLAVGGTWPGNPDATTQFPARMRIAWVRAWKTQ